MKKGAEKIVSDCVMKGRYVTSSQSSFNKGGRCQNVANRSKKTVLAPGEKGDWMGVYI